MQKEYIEPWVGFKHFPLCIQSLAFLSEFPPISHASKLSLPEVLSSIFLFQDYYTNYPVTLPVRRPYSGNPGKFSECYKNQTAIRRAHHIDA